ncbi:unnamed protein product [Tuber aestivum]|uniref:Uncharacterized protein n=1 Tax=Tuber aestivum TaxID=59557 RepID=A0A292Q4U7_9PEZI|nr:unnamed protein product [Tuber aestivum]
MLQKQISNTLIRSSTTLLARAATQQTRSYNGHPAPYATEKKHGSDVQSEQSQSGMTEKAESSMFTEAHGRKEPEQEFKNAPGPITGRQDEWGGSMPFPYYAPPVWNSFGTFVGV